MRDDAVAGRFEIGEGDGIVFADYRRSGDLLFIDHVEAPPAPARAAPAVTPASNSRRFMGEALPNIVRPDVAPVRRRRELPIV